MCSLLHTLCHAGVNNTLTRGPCVSVGKDDKALGQGVQQIGHIGGHIGFEPHVFAADRVHKAQNRRVQRLPVEPVQRRQSRIVQRALGQLAFATINRIAHQPVTGMGHMNANLVGAAGFQPAFASTSGVPNR